MHKSNIEQIIRQSFRENMILYPEDCKTPKAAKFMVDASAKSYWDNRNEHEQQRDKEAGVTKTDYKQWCRDEYKAFKENNQ